MFRFVPGKRNDVHPRHRISKYTFVITLGKDLVEGDFLGELYLSGLRVYISKTYEFYAGREHVYIFCVITDLNINLSGLK